ncbi:hypothetical protein GCM10028796_53030 [Ramlibacter monticola]
MGVASAEGVGASTGGSAATPVSPGSTDATMAAATTGATEHVQGSPGTQSGPAVMAGSGPTIMGASSGKGSFAIPGRQYSIITSRTAIDTTGLSGTQLRELERHLALR